MKSSNVLVALAIVQTGTISAPAFARAGYSSVSAPPAVNLSAPKAPVEPERSLKGTPPKKRKRKPVVVQPADEPANFSNKFSSICNQMLSFPVAVENGSRSDAYEVAADLAVPRQQVSRLLDMGPAESFKTRLLAKFRALLGRTAKAQTEVDLVIPDIGQPNIDVETKRTLEMVDARLAELQSDSYKKPNSHYLMRHALHSRERIEKYLERMIVGAQNMDAALVARQAQAPAETVAPPIEVPVVDLAPTTAAVEPSPALVNPDYNFPFNIDWSNVKVWTKQLGLAAGAGMGVVFMVHSDPKWILGTMVSVAAGVAFVSAPVRDGLGRFRGWIKTAIDRRLHGVPETFEETLARRLERTRVQAAVLEQIRQRMMGVKTETGLSYYSYVAEAEAPHALTQPVVPIGVPPRPQPAKRTRLVRVEHVVYTNLNSHRMLTFVSDLTEPVGPFTEVSLVHQ